MEARVKHVTEELILVTQNKAFQTRELTELAHSHFNLGRKTISKHSADPTQSCWDCGLPGLLTHVGLLLVIGC